MLLVSPETESVIFMLLASTTFLARVSPLECTPEDFRATIRSPFSQVSPVMISSFPTTPMQVPERSNPLTISGRTAISPPTISMSESSAPLFRPFPTSLVTFSSGLSMAM